MNAKLQLLGCRYSYKCKKGQAWIQAGEFCITGSTWLRKVSWSFNSFQRLSKFDLWLFQSPAFTVQEMTLLWLLLMSRCESSTEDYDKIQICGGKYKQVYYSLIYTAESLNAVRLLRGIQAKLRGDLTNDKHQVEDAKNMNERACTCAMFGTAGHRQCWHWVTVRILTVTRRWSACQLCTTWHPEHPLLVVASLVLYLLILYQVRWHKKTN